MGASRCFLNGFGFNEFILDKVLDLYYLYVFYKRFKVPSIFWSARLNLGVAPGYTMAV